MDESKSATFVGGGGFGLGAVVVAQGTNSVAFDPGYVFNLGLGYRLPHGFRVEVEGGYAHYNIGSISPFSPTVPQLNGSKLTLTSGGGIDQYAVTLNAFYDLPVSSWCIPYLGAGGGVNFTNVETSYFVGPGVTFTEGGGNSTNALILGEVGVAFALDTKWTIVPAYRFEKVFTSSSAFANNDHLFKLGVRYSP